ncbi:hypothetical protein EY643_12915 [Halioglobus maricola]|uniref:DUF2269 family protein n=1 Tax=Halioglobus maricola TaxID=2601894 RepID=A0A5P9NLV5_9GAMM|nr:hypothetical protein [Halioglobus maricola]QFU76486.1 hypothetical protein EY643_12915 [Halioglobus maricola]
MNEYLLLKFAHILAFVYWLGGDLGTFLASQQVINRDNAPESRHVALKIMLACDMGPKLAMPLILPLGVHMAAIMGTLPLSGMALALIWGLCLYWFTVVLVLYLNEGKPFTAILSRLDFWFRIAFASGLAAWAIYTFITPDYGTQWAAIKLLVFVAMVGCGVLIRVNLAPFVPAFGDLMANGPTDANNSAMERSIGRCRPWVWCIWAGLFFNAAMGLHLFG